jgi:multidrug efflux system outer membrane protein
MRTRYLIALAVLAVGACKPGPNYERPALPAPQAFRDSMARDTVRRDTTFADLPWWRVFQDTTLQRLVRIAVDQNLDLQVAAERVLQAEGRLGITRSDLYPSVTASTSADRSGTDESSPYQSYRGGVNVFWELDLFGRIRRSTERERAFLLATEEARRGVVLSLVSTVAASYVNLRTLDQQLVVARRTADSRREYVAIARQRFEGGVTGEIDYRQAQAQYEDARTIVINLQESIANQEHALSTLLGNAPGAIPRGRSLESQPLPASVPVGLPSSLLERRPDLREAEARLAALTANVGVAKAQLYPNISLTGALGLASVEIGNYSQDAATWSLGASLFQSIFQGGRLRANVRVSESQMREGILSYRAAVLRALQETEDALVAVRLAGDRTASLDSQVVYNRIVLRLAEIRYEGGVAQYLEVLDAQRQLLNTELLAADARRQRLLAYVNLYRALGGGWQQDPTATAAPTR